MKVIYRASGYPSAKPLPVNWDKPTLLKKCLESFIDSGARDITFLLDGIADKTIFKKYGDTINTTGLGNIGTFHKQLELARGHEKVFFVEDDYLWRKNTFHLMEEAVETLDFVSPYDHPGHYIEEQFDKHYETRLIGNTVWRDSPSNTLTFAARKEVLDKTIERIKMFGVNDHAMFSTLKTKGFNIWCPTYSIATHLVEGLLAPNVDWSF